MSTVLMRPDARTQTMESRLLKLLSRQWVTPLDALREVQCLSLSQRCGDFRRAGHTILSAWVRLPNGKRVMSYRLSKAAGQKCKRGN